MRINLCSIALIITLLFGSSSTTFAREPLHIGQIEGTLLKSIGEPILKEAYAKIGYEVVFDPLPSKRSLFLVSNGELDGEMLRTNRIAELYPDLIKTQVPIFTNATYAISKNSRISITNWNDLKQYRLAIIKGLLSIEKRTEGMTKRPVISYEAALNLLINDQVDLVVVPIFHAASALHKAQLHNSLHILTPPLLSTSLFHYVHKNHAGLVPSLERALQKMHRDGTIQKHVSAEFLKKGIEPPKGTFGY